MRFALVTVTSMAKVNYPTPWQATSMTKVKVQHCHCWNCTSTTPHQSPKSVYFWVPPLHGHAWPFRCMSSSPCACSHLGMIYQNLKGKGREKKI